MVDSLKEIEKSKIKIFLVDDDPLYLKLLENQFLENPAIQVTCFASGEACLLQLHQKPDVIVLDYFLNGSDPEAKNGLAILIRIKEATPDIQVIMLSSYENVEIALNCVSNNAFNFIVKNDTTYLRLKHSIKQIFSHYSKIKELAVWDW
jgi:two-component system OmpR family response regulator